MNRFRMVFCVLSSLCVAASGFSLAVESSSASQAAVAAGKQSVANGGSDTGWGVAPQNSSMAF